MAQRKRSQRLSGLNPLAYLGVEPYSPVEFTMNQRPPTTKDNKNVFIGDIWLDISTNNPPENNDIYMLVSLTEGDAIWVNFGGGNLETLTGNTGGVINPDVAGNIDVLGTTAQGITVTGTPITNTLTITTVNGENLLQSLTGDVGGIVYADANQNINILGTASILTVTGTPGTNTLTLTVDGSVATSFNADVGTAVPAGHVLNILGTSVLNTSAVGNTVSVNVDSANDGEVIIGATGLDPAWASITSTTITITPGPNTLNLEYTSPVSEAAFLAYLSGTVNNVTGDSTIYTVIYDTELFDLGGDYDHTTGQFTAPFDGQYSFSGNVSVINDAVNGGTEGNYLIVNNTTGLNLAGDNYPTARAVAGFAGLNGAISYYGQFFLALSAGDVVTARIRTNNGGKFDDVEGGVNPLRTFFGGFLLYRT